MGTLYYGDNLDILRRYLKDETVDLVYLDPPFNSAQNYNAFFHEKDGTDAASQIRAFEDTWSWNQESQKVYEELILQPGKVREVMQASHTFLGTNDMMAYLAMMAPRLVELRRAGSCWAQKTLATNRNAAFHGANNGCALGKTEAVALTSVDASAWPRRDRCEYP